MSKLNRRDYLKQMAVGAAAIAGSKLEVFAQHPHRRKSCTARTKAAQTLDDGMQTQAQLDENFQRWPFTSSRPTGANISVSLHGLLDFYYNDNTHSDEDKRLTCGIGFHRGGEKHYAEINVKKNGADMAGWPKRIENNALVVLGVVDAAGNDRTAGWRFLKNKREDDFRRMIDMQSKSWYQGIATKTSQAGIYVARLFIRHGTFFTEQPTTLKLKKVIRVETTVPFPVPHVPVLTGGNLGKPAEHVGGDILLTGTDKVSLKVSNQGTTTELISLPNNAGEHYEVEFSNICYQSAPHGPKCDFDWQNFKETLRNDFHHHRDILALPGFSSEYTVILGECPPARRRGDRDKANTVEAPCMGAGYGGGNGPCNC